MTTTDKKQKTKKKTASPKKVVPPDGMTLVRKRPTEAKLPGSETKVVFADNSTDPNKLWMDRNAREGMIFSAKVKDMPILAQVLHTSSLRGATGSKTMVACDVDGTTWLINWRFGARMVEGHIVLSTSKTPDNQTLECYGETLDTGVYLQVTKGEWHKLSELRVPVLQEIYGKTS